jgi:hypothetical protein
MLFIIFYFSSEVQCSGNGDLAYEEAKTHFTAWALMKSPLLISAHVSALSAFCIRRVDDNM